MNFEKIRTLLKANLGVEFVSDQTVIDVIALAAPHLQDQLDQLANQFSDLYFAAQDVVDNATRPGSRVHFKEDGDVWVDYREVDETPLQDLTKVLSTQTKPEPYGWIYERLDFGPGWCAPLEWYPAQFTRTPPTPDRSRNVIALYTSPKATT